MVSGNARRRHFESVFAVDNRFVCTNTPARRMQRSPISIGALTDHRSCTAIVIRPTSRSLTMTLDRNRWRPARTTLLFCFVSPLLVSFLGPCGVSVTQVQLTASDYRVIGESTAGQVVPAPPRPLSLSKKLKSPIPKTPPLGQANTHPTESLSFQTLVTTQ